MHDNTNPDFIPLPGMIGRYRILQVQGRGGMGVVYRAQDMDTGAEVALKTVCVISEDQMTNIRREIRSLARIQHPGIVRILAEGVENGLPWYAMELLDGATLHTCSASRPITVQTECTQIEQVESEPKRQNSTDETIRLKPVTMHDVATRTPEKPASGSARRIHLENLKQMLTIMRRLCRTLSYLHGEGIVHRDLKPDNILVQNGEYPIIVDFGVAAQFSGAVSREFIDIGGIVVGTLAYMAPEQIRGEFVDARADLYSLGCILYELVTGQLPFQHISTMQIIQAQLYDDVVAPKYLVSDCPIELDNLIMRLLEKQPGRRFGYADDVSKILGELGGDDRFPSSCPEPQSYLYRSSFVGREEATNRIGAQLDDLIHGKGGMVLIGGETGVGKTRLAMEITRQALDRNLNVLASDCQSIVSAASQANCLGAQPLGPFRTMLQAIASECQKGGLAATEHLLGRRGKVLVMYEPLLASLPGQTLHPDPVELPQEAASERAMTYLAETLMLFTSVQPALLIIDDLQWADAMTIGFLNFLVLRGQLPKSKCLILATYRTEEIGNQIDEISQNQTVLSFKLTRLAEEVVERMVGDMLAIDTPPRSLISFLSLHSEGNPFFIAEYMRMLVSKRILFRDALSIWHVASRENEPDDTSFSTMVLPRSLRDLVRQRLAGISNPLSRQVLDASSILGREFEPELLARVTSLTATELQIIADDLIHLQFFEVRAGNLRFVHDKQREVAYDALDPDIRIRLHRRAALAIDTLFRDRRNEFLMQLGYHWEASLDPDRARECYLAAALLAVDGYSIDQAEKLFQKYFSMVQHPTLESIRMRVEYATHVLISQGRMLHAIAELERGFQEARAAGEDRYQGICLQALADALRALGRYAEARKCCARALAFNRAGGNRKTEAITISNLAMIAYGEGQLAEARRLLLNAIAIHRQTGDQREEAISVGRLGSILVSEGKIEEAQVMFESAISIHRENGNRRDEAAALANLNSIFWAQNRLDDAAVTLERALQIFEEIGDLRGAGMVLTNLATVYLMQHRITDASHMHDRAIAFHRQFGERTWEGVDLMNQAGILHKSGNLTASLQIYEEAIAILTSTGDHYSKGQAIGHLGIIYEEMSNFDRARQCYQNSIRTLRDLGDNLYVPFTLYRLAKLERISGNQGADRASMLKESENAFRQIGNDYMVGMCIVERGYIAIERGESVLDFIFQAKQISKSVLTRNPGKLKVAVEELLQASASSGSSPIR